MLIAAGCSLQLHIKSSIKIGIKQEIPRHRKMKFKQGWHNFGLTHSRSQKTETDIMVATLLMENLQSLPYEIIVHIGTQVRAVDLTRNNHETGHFFPTAFPLGLFEEPPVEVLSAGALTSRSLAPSLAALLAALVSLAALMNLVTSCIHLPQHFNKTITTFHHLLFK